MMQRILGHGALWMEGNEKISILKFFQGLLVALIPKWALSRGLLEFSESTFQEVSESATIYFLMPGLGSPAKSLLHKIVPKDALNKKFDIALLTRPLNALVQETGAKAGKLGEETLRRVLATKFAVILSTFGLTVAGAEYPINYIKNLLTFTISGKESFDDVVNLSKSGQQHKPANTNSPLQAHAITRLKQCAAVCVGLIAGAVGLARFGHKLPLSTDRLKKLVGHTDFNYTASGTYKLSRPQMWGFMALAIPAYLSAARPDPLGKNLESKEILSRLIPVMLYLGVGQEALEKGLIKLIGNKYNQTPVKVLNADKTIRSFEAIAQDAMAQARQKLGSNALKEVVEKEAGLLMKEPLVAKNILFWGPMAFGVGVTGLLVGGISRFWTSQRYKKAQLEKMALPPPSTPLTSKPMQTQPIGLGFNVAAPSPFPMASRPVQSITQSLTTTSSPAFPITAPLTTSPSLPFNHLSHAPNLPLYPAKQLNAQSLNPLTYRAIPIQTPTTIAPAPTMRTY